MESLNTHFYKLFPNNNQSDQVEIILLDWIMISYIIQKVSINMNLQ